MNFPSLFVPSQNFYHLNAGTQSRTPIFALDEMAKVRREEEVNPTESFYRSYPKFWSLQKGLADFLGASPHDIFLRSNITMAMNDFLFAVPLQREGEIVVSSWEYGAISNIAKERALLEGRKFRIIDMDRAKTNFSSYIEEQTANAALLLISHVSTGNGELLPVLELAKAAKKNNTIVVVDGAHAVGAIPLCLNEFDSIDFYGGNFHKWFLGPKGTAFGWVHPKWAGKIPWNFGGWASFEAPEFYQSFAEGNWETAKRFFPGSIDPTPFWGLEKVLQLWQKEAQSIRAYQKNLRNLLLREMEQDFECITHQEQSPILAFSLPKAWGGIAALDLANRIYYESKVQVAFPKVGNELLLRITPGIYISEEEATRGARALKEFRP